MEKCSCKCGSEASNLTAKTIKIGCLIDYQKGSIVSRTLLDKKTGSVTLFAFDRGQKLSEHTAPFDAMVQVVDGEADILINGKSNRVSAGALIIMPAGIPHAVKAVRRFKMLLTMIRS